MQMVEKRFPFPTSDNLLCSGPKPLSTESAYHHPSSTPLLLPLLRLSVNNSSSITATSFTVYCSVIPEEREIAALGGEFAVAFVICSARQPSIDDEMIFKMSCIQLAQPVSLPKVWFILSQLETNSQAYSLVSRDNNSHRPNV